ncbi:hypothetical protein OUZ56_007935 [Daphnia magna]|uniref:Uncharacterized protein n=1 Tax=Daphnia magna TaxID=35525 RepID=A0ABR0ABF7_9CRUS|nr:hypothetical protein OUZ56_007935 [Daphnia magna]
MLYARIQELPKNLMVFAKLKSFKVLSLCEKVCLDCLFFSPSFRVLDESKKKKAPWFSLFLLLPTLHWMKALGTLKNLLSYLLNYYYYYFFYILKWHTVASFPRQSIASSWGE